MRYAVTHVEVFEVEADSPAEAEKKVKEGLYLDAPVVAEDWEAEAVVGGVAEVADSE